MTIYEAEKAKLIFKELLMEFLSSYELSKDSDTRNALIQKFSSETFNLFNLPKGIAQIELTYDGKTNTYR